MPKAEPHFDAPALLEAVISLERLALGLRITTNNPSRFKAIMYAAAGKADKKLHIYEVPGRPNSLALLKDRHDVGGQPSED